MSAMLAHTSLFGIHNPEIKLRSHIPLLCRESEPTDRTRIARNYVRAHMWLNLAGEAGNADAAKNRDAFAWRMTSQQIAEAQNLIRECRRGSARLIAPPCG